MFKKCLAILLRVRFCRSPAGLAPGTIVFFPVSRTRIPCGLAGIVEIVRPGTSPTPDLEPAAAAASALSEYGVASLRDNGAAKYAGGAEALDAIDGLVGSLRRPPAFSTLFRDGAYRERVKRIASRIEEFVRAETALLDAGEAMPDPARLEVVNRSLVRLKDAAWALDHELLANVSRVRELIGADDAPEKAIREYRKANQILNAIDRLEIRGRDSAGILFQVGFPSAEARAARLRPFEGILPDRAPGEELPDGAISLSADGRTATFVYKVAAEVGKLGDNVAAIRRRVSGDGVLRELLGAEDAQVLVMAHTRWASNGIINLPNCHPLDNRCAEEAEVDSPRIHVALNGDIDNYLELRDRFEKETGRRVPERITTDAKVIGLWIDHHLREGVSLAEAFRRAVSEFRGSAAITMTSDLEPGRLYLSLKGSGQSLYVGLAPSGYVVASEIYGLVEETSRFVKLEGERERVPGDETTRGQVFVLDGDGECGIASIRAYSHDGTTVELGEGDVKTAEITTRDVDRGDFPHYFLKEVSQAPGSVAKTLRGKFSREGDLRMGDQTIPPAVARALAEGTLERIVVVGQGTASIAAMAISAFLVDSLRDTGIHVEAMKASELSGFWLAPDMSRTLVIPVTQSGATADTNRAVDLARERGAFSIAIVNRRNSDITFKTAGVLYTSDGRDVEMSVASTKAFYSQVVAGALLGLAFGRIAGSVDGACVREHLANLRTLPGLLERVFDQSEAIGAAAEKLAPTRRYWTVVGSGPNRIAAEEVRIKLSELCYKSISADSVEDKKHIDLSSESLILVLAAGNHDSVLSDLAKDVAIFKAHRALPVVFATEGDRRFDEYASAVVEIPPAPPLISMVLATMAGHLFGYHAARAIDGEGRFLGRLRSVVVASLDRGGVGSVREIGRFAREYRERLRNDRFASALEAGTATELAMLLKYAAGVIPPATFEEEYGREPGPAEIQATLLESLVEAIDQTARPIDAIKHQAKIVTVGTSRPSERPTGPVFDALAAAGVGISAVTFADRARLLEVQTAVSEVTGVTRYTVSGLDPDGAPGEGARVVAVERSGTAAGIPSRADQGAPLKGTKRSVVADRTAFVGVGVTDARKIAIVPIVDHRFAVTSLVLLHLAFHADLRVEEKVRALGSRYDALVNGVTEADVAWSDDLLAPIPPDELVTAPVARLAERILRGRAGITS